MPKKRTSIIIAGVFLILIVICVCPIASISLDTQIGLWRVSKEVGISSSWSELDDYVQDSLVPGMSREEVMNVLSALGKTRVTHSSEIVQGPDSGDVREGVRIRIGILPTSEMLIGVRYDQDGLLKAVHIIRS